MLSLNCNSIKGKLKNHWFKSLVEQHDPHVILGCESKLNSSLATYSLFPQHYDVYRKDRTNKGGGVFCAVRNDLVCTEEKSLDKDNECIWSSIQLAKSQKLYIASYYRPPRAGMESLDDLENALNDIPSKHTHRNPNIIIMGDFNAPDINWDQNNVDGNSDAPNARKLLQLSEHFVSRSTRKR